MCSSTGHFCLTLQGLLVMRLKVCKQASYKFMSHSLAWPGPSLSWQRKLFSALTPPQAEDIQRCSCHGFPCRFARFKLGQLSPSFLRNRVILCQPTRFEQYDAGNNMLCDRGKRPLLLKKARRRLKCSPKHRSARESRRFDARKSTNSCHVSKLVFRSLCSFYRFPSLDSRKGDSMFESPPLVRILITE